jgi:hypothetical protein
MRVDVVSGCFENSRIAKELKNVLSVWQTFPVFNEAGVVECCEVSVQ